MRDWQPEILRFLEAHSQRHYKAKELQRFLKVSKGQYPAFRRELLDLAHRGRIAMLPRRRFQALGGASQLEGLVGGVGERATHVRLADGSRLPLLSTAVDRVLPGDKVRIRRVREDATTVARVEAVTWVAPRQAFGTLQRVGPRWVLVPDRPIPGFAGGAFVSEMVPLPLDADGSLARASLPGFDPRAERPQLEAVEVLGADDHPRAAIARVIAASRWPTQFSPAALDIAASPREDPHPHRDLTDRLVFTIDPQDAKDHDDAVSIAATPEGFLLGVHIADVASFVREDSALDDEALQRTTSVYPPGGVLPMLPERLSNGECSLHHGVVRRTLSVDIHYTRSGQRTRVDLGRGRIRSRASLSYEDAERMLEDPAYAPDPSRSSQDDGLRQALGDMLELATTLRRRRADLGSLFVQRPERVFEFGEDGRVDAVRLRPLLRSHWIIEEFMLEANRAVAEALHRARLPLLWRIHEEPDEAKVNELVEVLKQLGVTWVPPYPVHGRDYADLFARVEGRDDARLIHLLALRSLMKAQYRAGWSGHFGLAFSHYTHFTSPIRRYPDLYNQRWLHVLLDASAPTGWLEDALATALTGRDLARPHHHADARRLADRCSDLERRAVDIERSAADICSADYLKRHEGEDWEGLIVSLVPSGVFVELDGTGLDGFVGVEQLPGDCYTLAPSRHAFLGERTGRRFRLGQRVRVLLEYVDVSNGRMWLGSIRPLRAG